MKKKFYAIDVDQWDADTHGEIVNLTDEQFVKFADLTFDSPDELTEFLNDQEALMFFFRYC